MKLFNFKKKKNSDIVEYETIPESTSQTNETSTGVQIYEEDREYRLEQSRLDNQRDMMECISNVTSTVVNGARDIANFYTQCTAMKERTKQIEMMTNLELAKITAQYQATELFLTETFRERGKALQKNYDVIDYAIKSNDREMIIDALQEISGIVTTSPLRDLEKFAKEYNDTSKQLLDF